MQTNTYLYFSGQCEAAFQFYQQCLNGKIELMLSHAAAPIETPAAEGWRDKIMHARMSVGKSLLMGSDMPPGHEKKPQGFSVQLGVEDPAEADRIFNALAENGTVHMPIQKTFWALRFGMLVDRFGIPWMINCEAAAA